MANPLSERLGVTLRRDGARSVISCSGELDHSTRDRFYRTAIAEVTDSAIRHVEVDLSEVTFLSAAGVHGLCELARAAERHATTFELGPAGGLVERILTIVGLREQRSSPPPDTAPPA
ncbi:STAS domain-containing protein [Amycolatopsis vancoresmycina]|uniref:Anti-sigma-factor antagonist n=1 Tax=Amycolatopsis vancoresmycina DSM 44592 TaxID=1292037 RepID=R1GGY2_9PSEU|nr:STAS domain-containing protein [Amycolatopsis vancoresmycina]EOD70492.1 anti-sigma-factor antagonist [Amycolatopsis vancoresmycina DSM 44592]